MVTIAERKSNRYVIEISVFYFNADTLHAHYELAQKKGVGEKKKHTYTFFFFFHHKIKDVEEQQGQRQNKK